MNNQCETAFEIRGSGNQDSKRGLWFVGVAAAFLLIGTTAYLGPLKIVREIWISISDDTEYAPGYTESGFRGVSIGDTEASVRRTLGTPLGEQRVDPYLRWLYTPHVDPVEAFKEEGEYPDIRFSFTTIDFGEDGTFCEAFGQISHGSTSNPLGVSAFATILTDGANSLLLSDAEIEKLVAAKATPAQIEVKFGKPQATFESKTVKWLKYSHSPDSKDFRQRLIGIDRTGKVCRKVDEIWWD